MPWNARNRVDLRMEMTVRLGQGEQLTTCVVSRMPCEVLSAL